MGINFAQSVENIDIAIYAVDGFGGIAIQIEEKFVAVDLEPFPCAPSNRFLSAAQAAPDEGLFDVRYPEMAALSILETVAAISHTYKTYRLEENTDRMKELVDATFDFIDRILGAEPGIFMEYATKMEGFT